MIPARSGFWSGAGGLGVLLTRWCTVRHLPRPFADGGEPRFGFPLAAFGWSGVSSGEWVAAVGPLAVDLAVGVAVGAVLWAGLARVAPARALRWMGAGVAAVAVAVNAETALKLAIGADHLVLGFAPAAESPCRTLSWGEPSGIVDWDDAADPCVAEALGRRAP